MNQFSPQSHDNRSAALSNAEKTYEGSPCKNCRGGLHHQDNLQILTRRENRQKGASL